MTARIFALFIALLTLLNLLGNLIWPGFDGSIWWISFGRLPAWFAQAVLALSALAMMWFAFRAPAQPRRFPLTGFLAAMLAVVALANALDFYRLLAKGRIAAGFPVPFSLLICLGMLLIVRDAWFPPKRPARSRRWLVAAGGVSLLGAFPVALMLFFGTTDYRRPADAAVVFGARAYADGRLSTALKDRIRTGCELYRAGMVKKLVLSGGPGDGATTEAEAMRNYAVSHGVRAEDVVLDDMGLNTDATVRNTTAIFRQQHFRRMLAVSHSFHLPRIKLAYRRAGIEVYTVPVSQSYILRLMPYNVVREVAAFWTYYLKQKPAA